MTEVLPYHVDKRYFPLRTCPKCDYDLKLVKSAQFTDHPIAFIDWWRKLKCALCEEIWTDRKCFTHEFYKGFLKRNHLDNLDQLEQYKNFEMPKSISKQFLREK